MWQAIAAIVIPVLGVIGGVIQSERGFGLNRRLKEHAALADLLASNPRAKAAIDELVALEAESLLSKQSARTTHKLNGANLSLAIFLALASGVVIYLLWNWTATWWGLSTGWIPLTVMIVVGLGLLLVTAAGFSIIYAPKTTKKNPAINMQSS
jgi:hypothetical protein